MERLTLDEEALWEAIVAQPDDMLVHGILADLYDERGRAEAAAVIRSGWPGAQVRLAKRMDELAAALASLADTVAPTLGNAARAFAARIQAATLEAVRALPTVPAEPQTN